MVYEPREDSFLLEEQVRNYARGSVLDVGTGSGILALAAAKLKGVKKVLAVDIDKNAVEQCRARIKNKKIRFVVSDLFAKVRGRFDTIIFNPPYLPQDKGISDRTIYGGKKGYETIGRFLAGVSSHLNPEGVVLLLFSSHTRPERVLELVRNRLFCHKLVAKSRIFFEELYVYLLKKSALLKELERKGVSEIDYFAHGKRGVVYTGIYKGRKIAIKVKRPESTAVGRIKNEAKFLRVVNKKGIGPKFLFSGKRFVAYEFAEGEFIKDWILKANRKEILRVLNDVLMQCFLLDEMGINKEEMHRPLKHIIVGKKPVLIDFERAHYSKSPKNVTQFCQYLISIERVLRAKGINISMDGIVAAAREYSATRDIKKIVTILKG